MSDSAETKYPDKVKMNEATVASSSEMPKNSNRQGTKIVPPHRSFRYSPTMIQLFRIALLILTLGLSCSVSAAPRRLLLGDDSMRRLAIVREDASIEWEAKVGPIHD